MTRQRIAPVTRSTCPPTLLQLQNRPQKTSTRQDEPQQDRLGNHSTPKCRIHSRHRLLLSRHLHSRARLRPMVRRKKRFVRVTDLQLMAFAANQSSGRKSQPTSDEALPRPLKHLNTQAARSGAAIKYGTASTEFPPAPTVP